MLLLGVVTPLCEMTRPREGDHLRLMRGGRGRLQDGARARLVHPGSLQIALARLDVSAHPRAIVTAPSLHYLEDVGRHGEADRDHIEEVPQPSTLQFVVAGC